MVYSWGLFWPRELGVLNQRRISPSFYGPRGGKTGRQANEITDSDRIITSLKEREREREETISLTCSASPIRPSDHHHLIFSAASSGYMRPRGECVCRCRAAATCLHACIFADRRCKWCYPSEKDRSWLWGCVSCASLRIHCSCMCEGGREKLR